MLCARTPTEKPGEKDASVAVFRRQANQLQPEERKQARQEATPSAVERDAADGGVKSESKGEVESETKSESEAVSERDDVTPESGAVEVNFDPLEIPGSTFDA